MKKMTPLKIIIIFLIASQLWIILTDLLVAKVATSPEMFTRLSMIKGGLYVAVAGLLLYWLIYRYAAERNRAEEAQQKSEQQLRVVTDTVPAYIAFVGPDDLRYKFVNSKFELGFGIPRKDIIGRHIKDIIGESNYQFALKYIDEVRSSGRQTYYENAFNLKQGKRWLNVTYVPTFDEQNKMAGIIMLSIDITERKRAEESLRAQEKVFRNLFNNTGVAMFRTRLDGSEIMEANEKFLELFGWTRDEVIGKPSVVHWAEPRQREEMLRRLKANGRVVDFECKMLNKKGEARDCITSLNLYPEEAILDGSIIDVTERRRAEEAISASGNLLNSIVENAPVRVFWKDAKLRYLGCNTAFARDAGFSRPEDLIGKDDFQMAWRAQAELYRADDKLVMDSDTQKLGFEEPQTAPGGHTIWLRTSKVPLHDAGGRVIGLLGIYEDITARKKAEEEHGKIEEQLRHAQKMEAIGTLAGGVAHDFNNILNVIMGWGGLVLEKMRPDDPSREDMNEVLAAADRAAILTRRLLIFSRKQVVEVKSVDVNDIVTGVQKMLSRVIGEDIDLKVDLMDKSLTVMADAGQIEQVLMNLATNARDAMPKGGRLVITTETGQMDDAYVAAYGYGKTGAYAVISVADTGKGMETETQKKIFEPFFTTKGIGEGTGLGLAVSYGIMKQHSGYIKCYSEVGKGTVFKIYLPLIEDTAAAGIKADAPVSVKGGTETILVAEDDPSLRKLDKIILESVGYSVITAEDGEDTVAKFMENRDRIKLVILDLVMPKKSGKEAYEEIKKMSPGIRTFFLSGYTMDMISRMEVEKGMEMLRKPVAPNDLLRKVREVLDS